MSRKISFRKEMGMRGMNRLPWMGAVLLIIAALGLSACGGGAAPSGGASSGTAQPAAALPTSDTGGTAATAAPAPAATAAPAAADTSGAAGNSEIVISLNADPPKLDPAQSSAFVDRQVLNNICDK